MTVDTTETHDARSTTTNHQDANVQDAALQRDAQHRATFATKASTSQKGVSKVGGTSAHPEHGYWHHRTDGPHGHNGVVFIASMAIVIAIVIACLADPSGFYATTSAITGFITAKFGWYYLLLVALIVICCVVFMFSSVRKIRLGDPTERPEFSYGSWIAMLFSAGMGIGLIFWGSAEPLSLYAVSSPEAPVGTEQALLDSLRYSFFHWGISAWTIYAVVALAIAYFKFRKKESFLLSSTLKPLFGDRVHGWIGKLVDIITCFATVAGVSTSLGLGAMQINGGLNYLFGIPNTFVVQVIIIVVTTFLFIASAVSGINKGLKYLSNINVIVAAGLMAICIVVGPTTQIFNAFVTTVGSYLNNFIQMSFNAAPFDAQMQAFNAQWTIFYWAWWIAWSPFVGIFIARISRGRTIGEFVTNVIFIPTVFSFLWFATFGTLADTTQAAGTNLAGLSTETVLFGLLDTLPVGPILCIVALVLVFTFFITSADSATFVLGIISEGGALDPRKRTKIVWGAIVSLIAAILLFAGGLNALQNALILAALPFSVVLILIIVSLFKELRYERMRMGLYLKPDIYPDKDRPFRSYEDEEESEYESTPDIRYSTK